MALDEWKKDQRRDFHRGEADLRALLDEWDPIPGSPADEYDCLIPQLYAHLRSGATSEEVEAFLARELEHHFGLDPPRERDRDFAERLVRWARSREWV